MKYSVTFIFALLCAQLHSKCCLISYCLLLYSCPRICKYFIMKCTYCDLCPGGYPLIYKCLMKMFRFYFILFIFDSIAGKLVCRK